MYSFPSVVSSRKVGLQSLHSFLNSPAKERGSYETKRWIRTDHEGLSSLAEVLSFLSFQDGNDTENYVPEGGGA